MRSLISLCCRCKMLTDIVLENMSEVLRTLRRLDSVTLDFSSCNGMTQARKDCFKQEFISIKDIKDKQIQI